MSSTRPNASIRTVSFDEGLRTFIMQIYNYMAAGLAITGLVAIFSASSPTIMQLMYNTSGSGQIIGLNGFGWLIALSPMIMAFAFGFGIDRMSSSTAQNLFWVYSVLMGLSLNYLFLVYTGTSIARVFFITAITFGGMSIYGNTTKKDLTAFGSFLIMGLFGIIVASIANIFFKSSGLNFAVSVLGVLIFTGLIAYDTQRLKIMYYNLGGNTEEQAKKVAVMGALSLYMDFINLFLSLLRLMGDRRD